jgi:hypothetical protein
LHSDIGRQTTGSGIFTISGGTLLLSAATFARPVIVGDAGSGTFVQDGGTVIAFGLDIGSQTTGSGVFEISSGTLLVSAAGSTGPVIVGDSGSAAYEQVGGTATFAGDVIVGAVGFGQGGTLSLNGPSNTSLKVSGDVVIARDDNSFGTFNYNTSQGAAAKLTLASSSTVHVGKGGVGTFNQGGGSLTVSSLDIGVDPTVPAPHRAAC